MRRCGLRLRAAAPFELLPGEMHRYNIYWSIYLDGLSRNYLDGVNTLHFEIPNR